MASNYNRKRYYTPSPYTQLMESREAHGKTQDELAQALAEIERLRQIITDLGGSHD